MTTARIVVMKITTIFAAALLIGAGATSFGNGIRIGDTTASRIAKDSSIIGKGQSGQCLPFAMALQKKLAVAGIPARVITYGYEMGGVPVTSAGGDISAQPTMGTTGRGAHAVVAYQDGDRTYIMDNQSWTPQWVHNAAPVQMAQQFSGINTSVKVARVVNSSALPKATAVAVTVPRVSKRLAAN
jgi:hypothetical protein